MTAFDFAPLLRPGPAAARGQMERLPEIQFHRRQQRRRAGAGRRADRGGATRCSTREGRTLSTYGFEQRPAGLSPLREFLAAKLKRDAGIACTADEILVTSGSLQAIDLVNGVLLARGDTVIIEQESYQGSINRLTRLGVNAVGIPLDGDGMRMDALADRARRSQAPRHPAEIHLHHPDRAEPDRHHPARSAPAELLRLARAHGVPIFEDDCYADLIWDGQRPPALYAMSEHGGVIHIGSFSKSIAPALRVGYIVAPWEPDVAHAGAQDRRRLRRAGADGAGGILPAAFRPARAGADARPAQRSSRR